MAKPKIVYVMRHPQYTIEGEKLTTERTETRDWDFHSTLTRTGEQQAVEFAKWMAETIERARERNPNATFEFISSPYTRAMQMAEIALEESGYRRKRSTIRRTIRSMECLGEIPFPWKKKKFKRGETRSRSGKMSNPEYLSYESYIDGWGGTAEIMEGKRQSLEEFYRAVQKSEADIIFVFSHRATIATMTWDLDHGRERRINELAAYKTQKFGATIPQTSITELSVSSRGKIGIRKLLGLPRKVVNLLVARRGGRKKRLKTRQERVKIRWERIPLPLPKIRRTKMVPHLTPELITGIARTPKRVLKQEVKKPKKPPTIRKPRRGR